MKTFLNLSYLFLLSGLAYASIPIKEGQFDGISKIEISAAEDKERLSIAAGLLSKYEIKARQLVNSLNDNDLDTAVVNLDANELLTLSKSVIESAIFRLPQCDEYLGKTMALESSLMTISHESLEKDYHHDGALPIAPAECYHMKDLFVHPATVMILVRDDNSLNQDTRNIIANEINEVLSHTEVVRQLVIY